MFALNLLRSQARRQFTRHNNIQMHTKAKFKDGGEHSTMNDLPIPQNSWQENNARIQKRYMIVMISGITAFLTSVLLIATKGNMVLNYSVPDYPYEEEEKEEEDEEAKEQQ